MSELHAFPTHDRNTTDPAPDSGSSDPGASDAVTKPLHEIESMDSYLQNYGKILGRQAIATLAPLHVPGRDPLPDFNDMLREPFEPQKHVVAAAVQMMDSSGSGFICGEMGCIAGESEVFDPVAGHYRRVDQITEPFHVIAYHDGKAVVGKASVPFIKGTRSLLRVTLSDGRTFVATDHHRILTDKGWQLVSEVARRLRESGPVPHPSIAEPSLGECPRDAAHLSRTPSGCQDDCQTGRHFYGERPRWAEEVDPEFSQQSNDARERNRESPPSDVRGDGSECSPPYPSCGHRSTIRSVRLSDCTIPLAASALRPFSEPCGPGESLVLNDRRSAGECHQPDTNRPSRLQANQFSENPWHNLGEFTSDNVHIISITHERHDAYYDFTVEVFHNYVMAGVVHHNTGKTLIGMTSIHQHANRSRRKGGTNGRYRAIVLCPDHLIAKWEREIKETINGAIVYRFDDWKGFARMLGKGRNGRWPKPQGAEYYIIGRNQAKWYPDWLGTSDPYRGFLGRKVGNSLSSRNVIVDRVPVTTKDGKPVSDGRSGTKLQTVTARVFACPHCGTVARDRKGLPLSAKEISNKKVNCEGKYLQMVAQPDRKDEHGLDRLCPMPERFKDSQPGHEVTVGGHRYVVTACGEPLWAFTSKPYRWAPSRIVQKQMRRFFLYLLIDECFPTGTRILTPVGQREIQDIRPGDDVYSAKAGEIVVRQVTRAIAKRLSTSLVKVTHSSGSFVCTPNHKICVYDVGYISAGDLKHGDMLTLAEVTNHEVESIRATGACQPRYANVPKMQQLVRRAEQTTEQAILLPEMRGNEAGIEDHESMQGMRQAVHVRADQESSFLLEELLDSEPLEERADEIAVQSGDGQEVGGSDPRVKRTNEATEPGCLLPAEGIRRQDGQALCWSPWGEWAHHGRTETPFGGYRVRAGASRQDGQPSVEMRLAGSREHRIEDWRGDRRSEPQYQASEIERCEKGTDVGSARLVDAPVLERPGALGSERCGSTDTRARISHSVVISVEPVVTEDEWVYDLEIEETHCYFAEGVLVSNCHEQKSDESAQSMAAGKLIASVRHTLALTGTLIGGYADHLFPLMMRMTPETLRAEGFEWGKDLAFSEAYGRIDRIISTREEGVTTSVGKSVRSMRRAKSGKSSERKAVRPGIMPTLFGRHMIGSSVFITLGEMADELPALHEYIGGLPTPDQAGDPFYIDTCCAMHPDQKAEYQRVESILKTECRELLIRGSMKLLGTMLWTTLGWPDVCYAEWGLDEDVVGLATNVTSPGLSPPRRTEHSVGYWDKPGDRHIDNWVGIVTPRVLDKDLIYPKEEALIDICLRHKAAGHQVWVYAQMTQKRNVTLRLKSLLERHGLKVGIMRAGDVDPKEREDWIAKHGREFDVMICHPKLVSTGLDLFSKRQGGHNYNCIVFYQTGYNLFDMRQAARRAWRIGQPNDCYVYYLYYQETMQQRAMSLMSKKMAAAHALEGDFSEEGLAAMAGEDNLQMALAKSLAQRIEDSDMQRSWVKVKSGEKRKAQLRMATLRTTPTIDPSPGSVAELALPRLHIHAPDSVPERPVILREVDVPVFDDALMARMFANLAANGMTLNDLAG
jgi:Intein splicing domain